MKRTEFASRGFTIIEVLVAAFLLLYASLAFFTVYEVSARESVHSQALYLADFTGDSLLEEVQAHQYGRRAPRSWGLSGGGKAGEWQTVSYDVWTDGRQQSATYHVQWHLKNGSFVGLDNTRSSDVVSLVISWAEGEGEDPPYGEFTQVYYKGDNRHLVLQVPVWK